MPILTEADQTLLPLALRENKGCVTASEWYFGQTPMPLQYAFHQILVPNVTYLAGIAAGKTTAVAQSYTLDCISIPHFKALNTSVTSTQAELVFEMINGWIETNDHLAHLVEDISLRPYPVILFKNYSEYHFRTAGKDARFIRGQEYDRINYDEAGLDYAGVSLQTLRGRLRGKRPDGNTRMARMDVTTSPTDAPWLEQRFNRGVKDHPTAALEMYRSIRATIYDNTHLTPQQVALMEADYTDEMIDVELRGLFPKYGLTMFPREHIDACTDMELNDLMTEAIRPETGKPQSGYRYIEHPRYGITHFELPAEKQGRYILAGDPGMGDPPKRNAPVVLVARIDREPWDIVYFDWVYGRGSYKPFLNSFKYAIEKYQPVLRGLDATGTQRAIEELAFESEGIVVEGLNFQRDKDAMINALSLCITGHRFRWPVIRGLINQMRTYKREEDKKLAQDIVMTLAEIAFLARWLPEEMGADVAYTRAGAFRNRKQRTTMGRRGRTRR
nr:terminase family protein [Anaerolineae bacterium]